MDAKVFYSTYTLLAVHVWLIVHRLGHLNTKAGTLSLQWVRSAGT